MITQIILIIFYYRSLSVKREVNVNILLLNIE